MTQHNRSPAHGAVGPDVGTARDPDAAGHRRMGADVDVVANLNQIVQFHAIFDHGVVERAAIDAGVGADLDVVADADCAQLFDLDPGPLMGREAKSVRPDHHTRVHDATLAQRASFPETDVRGQAGV